MSPFHTIMLLPQSHCGPLGYNFLQSGVYLHLAPPQSERSEHAPQVRTNNMEVLPGSLPGSWGSFGFESVHLKCVLKLELSSVRILHTKMTRKLYLIIEHILISRICDMWVQKSERLNARTNTLEIVPMIFTVMRPNDFIGEPLCSATILHFAYLWHVRLRERTHARTNTLDLFLCFSRSLMTQNDFIGEPECSATDITCTDKCVSN